MVGGGQLARMTAQAAVSLGLTLRVLAERADDGAALVVPDVELGAPDDLGALARFAKSCDVVPFDHEHALQVARRPSGEMAAWPLVETVQQDGICVEVIAPAPRVSPSLASDAQRIAKEVATELDVTGVLAVELFEAPGGLMVNE